MYCLHYKYMLCIFLCPFITLESINRSISSSAPSALATSSSSEGCRSAFEPSRIYIDRSPSASHACHIWHGPWLGPRRQSERAKSNSHIPVVPAGDSVWSILYRWQRSTVSLACTMIRVAIVAARRNKERFPLITASPDSKVATVPFPSIYHEHNHDSKHNLIDCIGILPRDDIYLPLAGSLLPIPTTYLYPGWPTLQKED
jgi:hypothetical protein